MVNAVRLSTLLCVLVAILFAGDADARQGRGMAVAFHASGCTSLAGAEVPAARIGLPTRGAVVADAAMVETSGPVPAYCRIRGHVLAADAGDPPIQFQLNLPATWNGRAVQFGGGGFNGSVVSGLGGGPGAAAGDPTPLARGFATYGGDSGHSGADGRFGLNAQALANYSGEAIKRTHDAASFLLRRIYGRDARRTYFVGGSKGGQEALFAAQHYPRDFDGIVSFYPAMQNQALVTAWFNLWRAAYGRPGAALNSAEQALLRAGVMRSCDALDGVADGIVANTRACRSTFAVNSLRCPDGADTGDTCLSDLQIDTLQAAAVPYRFPFPLANGIVTVGPFPVYQGADVASVWFDPTGANGGTTAYGMFADQVVRFFVARDPAARPHAYQIRDHQERVQEISALFDATRTDLDAFRDRGGRMIIVQGTTDMLVPESMTSAYVDSLQARYGAGLRRFARYYVQPGYGHGQGAFLLNWDALTALDRWVEEGRAPESPVARDANMASAGRTMPLCEYPLYPRYRGTGDARDQASYRCATPADRHD